MSVQGQAPAPAVNPSALSGVRFLLTQRIEDLEQAAARLDARLADTADAREELRRRTEESEKRWRGLLDNLHGLDPDELDNGFRSLARFRADLAAVDERFRDVSARLIDLRGEQEVLRSVYRSLDDLAAAATPPPDNSRVRDASRQVFQIIEEERMRIARDMHDGPAQSMANLVLQAEILERLIQRDPAQVVQELADFKDGVRAVLEDTRRLIFDLRPMTLDDLGLVPTLRKFVKDYGDKAKLNAQLRVMGEEVRLPGSYEPSIFRIIQEALNNARKHAKARNVEVLINFQEDSITAVVRDDGVGMDVAAIEGTIDGNKHLGLISMRERAELEKGTLEIRSELGKGTEVRAGLPL
ncbi:MAG TPA: sensor histidine kinase [Candidatus Dormibacteraeota bacterium]|nr:sensor histidine kinase [Candidatus Dormibacteraeota bacterium]